MEQALREQLVNKALLYDLRVHAECRPEDVKAALVIIANSNDFSLQLAVIPPSDANWASPILWSESFLVTNVSELETRIRDTTTRVYQDLVLAWKKQRQP